MTMKRTARNGCPTLCGAAGELRGSSCCRREILAAIGAVLIGFRDFALALRAGRVQVAFAIGAEVETCADRRAALRTVVGQWLAHQQVDNEAEDEVAGHQHQYQEGPQRRMHTATLCVLIDAPGHENHRGEDQRHPGDNPYQGRASCPRIGRQLWIEYRLTVP